jgi:hypothetical protein
MFNVCVDGDLGKEQNASHAKSSQVGGQIKTLIF